MYGAMDDGKGSKRHSDDFGPIGTPLLTRNSPPFMQQWEPMGTTSIQQPIPSMQNYAYQNHQRSRFLDSFQNRTDLTPPLIPHQQDNILEAANLMSQYPVWNADRNVLMEMFNLQQQQEQLEAWNRQSTAWNPMNYSNTPTTSTTTVRPPPGLTLNRERQQLQVQQQQLQGSHISNIRPDETSVVGAMQQPQMQQQQQGNEPPMRTYDPFKSLSYLWQGSTDLWHTSNNNNNNKKQE